MKPELAALVIHDLKNALITLEAELDSLRVDPNRALAAQAHARCAAMRGRFMNFLTLYGSDGELHAYADDESPQAFLNSLVTNIASTRAGATPVVTTSPCEAAPMFWYFDVRLVRMALDAALHNAMRFARRQVVLGAREDSGHLVFSVDDDGPGIGSVDLCRTSTGLGTTLSRAVAHAHATAGRSGDVRLFNRPDGGARFELWLA